jgi:DNA replication protein DnaC
LDELGFIPFSPSGAQVLFTFCSELYERLALILTTNLKVRRLDPGLWR